MIRERNQQEIILKLAKPGTPSAAATHVDAVLVPFTGFIKAIYAVLGTADGTSFQADIQDNGTSIAASGNLLVFGTNTTPSAPTFATNPVPVTKGDVLTLSTPTVTGGQARDLVILIVLSKRPIALTENQTLGADFDNVN